MFSIQPKGRWTRIKMKQSIKPKLILIGTIELIICFKFLLIVYKKELKTLVIGGRKSWKLSFKAWNLNIMKLSNFDLNIVAALCHSIFTILNISRSIWRNLKLERARRGQVDVKNEARPRSQGAKEPSCFFWPARGPASSLSVGKNQGQPNKTKNKFKDV